MRRYLTLIAFGVTLQFAVAMQPLYAQGPGMSPMVYFPGDDLIGPAAGNQAEPDVAMGDGMYLFVWEDDRTGLMTNNTFSQTGTDIFAARVGADGEVIDTAPIPVSLAPHRQTNPEAHWNGENWIVFWESLDLNPAETYYSVHIRAARISPQGELLDNPPINVYSYPWSSDAMIAGTSAGSEWVVVSQGTSSGENSIKGFRIAADGTVINPNGRTVLAATYYLRFDLDLTFATDQFYMIWKGSGRLKGLRINSDLSPIGTEFDVFPSGGYVNRPRIITDGYDYLIGYEAVVQNYYRNPFVARISHAGELLDPNGIMLRQMTGNDNYPKIAWDGTNWVAAWSDLYVARINPDGQVLDPNGIHIPSAKVEEVTAGIDGGAMITYTDGSLNLPHNKDIFGISVSADMTPGESRAVSLSAPNQMEPDFAGSGNTWMLCYASYLTDTRRILVRPFDASGTPLSDEPVEVGSGGWFDSPSIAYNGTYFFVTWHDGFDDKIYGRRVTPDGVPVDQSPILIQNGYDCDVAAVGSNFGVIANYYTTYIERVYPFLVRVDGTNGDILDSSPINIGTSYTREPTIESFGDQWLAAWQAHISHDDAHNNLVAAFINADGVPGNPFIVAAGTYRYAPAIGAGPDEALITWQDPRASNANWNVYGRRILPNGQLLDDNSIAITQAPENQGNSSIGWDGTQFFVLFEDMRNVEYFYDNRTDVYGTRVTLDGAVLDPFGFVFSNSINPEIQPAVAASDGFTVLGAAIFNDQQPNGAYRVGMRFVGQQTSVDDSENLPENYFLTSSYPNPFNASATIEFQIPDPGRVTIEIYNVLGQKITTLVDDYYQNGKYTVSWDASSQASGVYYYRVRSGDSSKVRSMTLLK